MRFSFLSYTFPPVFPLTANFLALMASEFLRPKIQIAQDSSATATRAHHLENPIGARLTSCTDPRRYWATSLLGRVLSVHIGHIGSFKPFSYVFRIFLHSRLSYFTLAFTVERRHHLITLVVYEVAVAQLENVLSKILSSMSPAGPPPPSIPLFPLARRIFVHTPGLVQIGQS